MSRKTFDPDNDTPLPPHGLAPVSDRLPCPLCGTPTLRVTLAQYGMRCFNCYEVYCRQAQPAPAFIGDKRRGGPKAWAWALKARDEFNSKGLTAAQRVMWREALHVDLLRIEKEQAADEGAAA